MKKCKVCGEEKELDQFYKNKTYTDGYASKCKQCHIKQTTANYFKKPSINENNKKRYFDNIDAERNRDYKRKYGISLDDYNEMLKKQEYRCKVCGEHASDVSKKRLFVDHCHNTTKVRGLLCHNCNTMLGLAKDNTSILEEGIRYLKENNG
jgi:DNA-binding transcriptional MerR regulator